MKIKMLILGWFVLAIPVFFVTQVVVLRGAFDSGQEWIVAANCVAGFTVCLSLAALFDRRSGR